MTPRYGSLTNYFASKLYYPRPHSGQEEMERQMKDFKQGRKRILLPQKPSVESPAGLSIAQAIRYFVNAINAVKSFETSQKSLLDKLTSVEIMKTYSNLSFKSTESEGDEPKEETPLREGEESKESARRDQNEEFTSNYFT